MRYHPISGVIETFAGEREQLMKKLLAFLCMAAFTATAFAASTKADLNDRLDKARMVINELEKVPENGIPDAIMEKAVCVAVVPSMVKAAFGIGGQYGQGVATCRTGHGWSAPVFIRLAGGSYGFQIGAKATDLVIVATNQQGMQALLKSKFKIGADASAAAGPIGREAGANTSINMSAELLTYSRAKGLFAGVDLDGTSVTQNQGDTDSFYGHHYSFAHILSGAVPVPAGAEPFVRTVAKYFHRAQD